MAEPSEAQLDIDAQVHVLKVKIARLHRQRNALSPISRLPTEILSRVFYFSFPAKIVTKQDQVCQLLRDIAPCQVSHQWRLTALHCTDLWTSFEVCYGPSPHVCSNWKVVEFLWDVCGEAKVSLDLWRSSPPGTSGYGSPTEVPNAVVARLQHHPHIFKSLSLSGPMDEIGLMFVPGKSLVFDALESLSILNIPHDGTQHSLPALFACQAPLLRRLELASPIIVPWKSTLLQSSRLTSITADHNHASGSYSELLGLLSSVPELETLWLTLSSPPDLNHSGHSCDTPIELLALTTLILNSLHLESLLFVLCNLKLVTRASLNIRIGHCSKDRINHVEDDQKRLWSTIGKVCPVTQPLSMVSIAPNGLKGWVQCDEYWRDPEHGASIFPGELYRKEKPWIWIAPPSLVGLDTPWYLTHTLSFKSMRVLSMDYWQFSNPIPFFSFLSFDCPSLEILDLTSSSTARQFVKVVLRFFEDETTEDRVPFPRLTSLRVHVNTDPGGWNRIAKTRTIKTVDALDWPVTTVKLDSFNSAALDIAGALVMRRERLTSCASGSANESGKPGILEELSLVGPNYRPLSDQQFVPEVLALLYKLATKVSSP